ncbi:MAG: hypothetical protein ACYSR5_10500 [Planctomycetota bacterium]|jgi:hypothetical protein
MDAISRKTYQGPLKAVILDWAGTGVCIVDFFAYLFAGLVSPLIGRMIVY